MKWYRTEDKKPPLSKTDKWDKEHGTSDRVITFGEFGMRFGKYNLNIDQFFIEGVSGSKVIVTHWAYCKKPNN